jgi:DnaJ-class molecular chaperone
VPPYAIVGGIPAKVIKYRFTDTVREYLLTLDYTSLTKKMIKEHIDDLYFDIEVPVVDSILGCDVIIDTINGKKLTAKIPSGSEDGYTLRFKGYGMPRYGTNDYGNMFGVIKLKMPKSLTTEERRILEALKQKEHFK